MRLFRMLGANRDYGDNVPVWRHSCGTGCDYEDGGATELTMNLRWSWHYIFCHAARSTTRLNPFDHSGWR